MNNNQHEFHIWNINNNFLKKTSKNVKFNVYYHSMVTYSPKKNHLVVQKYSLII